MRRSALLHTPTVSSNRSLIYSIYLFISGCAPLIVFNQLWIAVADQNDAKTRIVVVDRRHILFFFSLSLSLSCSGLERGLVHRTGHLPSIDWTLVHRSGHSPIGLYVAVDRWPNVWERISLVRAVVLYLRRRFRDLFAPNWWKYLTGAEWTGGRRKKKTHTTERIDRRPLAGWRGGEIGGGSAPAEITGANKRYTRPKTIKGNQDRVGWQWRHIQSTNQLPTPRYKSSIPPLLTAIDGRYFYIVWSFNSLFFFQYPQTGSN